MHQFSCYPDTATAADDLGWSSVFPQTFKLFENLAEHERERALGELQKREESKRVPAVVQELEVTSEPCEEKEQSGAEAAQVESTPSDSGDVSTAEVSDVSASGGGGVSPPAEGDQAASAEE